MGKKAASCILCGRDLPPQSGVGRRRQFCGATCKAVAVALSLFRRALMAWAPTVTQATRDRMRGEIWSQLNVALGKADARS